ncbi:uncharacterized protein LOC123425235 [Hordeum vulgare subsp. vulgare]|uniref:uncharacterized protein LOC123425235 n=1 Tax=Hordeum vulgare subsp. vulgare TaxID=112509 RepID=UPI001D1A5A7F|nr:uncharacterized protein LOC123425235 [Hordeum vulgare subsp. vulgare]
MVFDQIRSDLDPMHRCTAQCVGSGHLGSCVGGGWDGVVAVHGGAGWFAVAACGRSATSRHWACGLSLPDANLGRESRLGVTGVTFGRDSGSDGCRRCGWATRHRQGCQSSTWFAPASPLFRSGGSPIDLVVPVAGDFVDGHNLPIETSLTAMEDLWGVLYPGGDPCGGCCSARGLSSLLRCGRLGGVVAGVLTFCGCEGRGPTEATPVDVVIFLKCPLWLLLSLRRPPDENLDHWIGWWWRFGVVFFLMAPSWSSWFVDIQLHLFPVSLGRAPVAP